MRVKTAQAKYLAMEAVLFLFFTYLALTNGGIWSKVNYSTQAANLALAALVGLAWLGWRVIRKREFPRTRLDAALATGLLAYLLATLASADPRRSLILLPQILIPILAFYLFVDLLRRGWPAELFEKAPVQATGLVIAYGLLQAYLWYGLWLSIGGWSDPIPPITLRVPSALEHPNILAGYMNLVIPLGVTGLLRAKRRPARILYLLWVLTALLLQFMTSSRGGWLGTAGVFSVLGFFWLNSQRETMQAWFHKARRRPQFMAAGAGVLLLLALTGGRVVLWQMDHPSHGRGLNREGIWLPAVSAFREDPLTGLGPFTYGKMYLNAHSVPPSGPMPHAHSLILQVLSETGLIGGAALLFLMVQLGRSFWDRREEFCSPEFPALAGPLAAFAGLFVHGLFDYHNNIPAINILLALLAALAAYRPVPAAAASRSQSRWKPALLPAGYALALGSLVWGLWAYRPYVQGIQAADRGDWHSAADRLDEAARRDPRLAANHFQAGLAHGMLALDESGALKDAAELARAVRAYETGLGLDPDYAVHWANLAALRWARGDREGALRDMEQAVQRAPAAFPFRLTLGSWYEAEGQDRKALEAYRAALGAAPILAESANMERSPLRAQALAAWQAAHPNPSPTSVWTVLSAGELRAALPYLEAAAQSKTAPAFLQLSLAYAEAGRLDAAEAMLRRSLFVAGGEVWATMRAHFGLQRVAALRGDREAAVREGETALEALLSTNAFGPSAMNWNHVYGRYYARSSIRPDLLPGIERVPYTSEAIQGMAQLAQDYRLTGQIEQAIQIEETLAGLAPAAGEAQ